MVDRGNTKGAILILTTKTLTQEGAGQLLLDNLYKRFGLPDKMLSDRGPQFAAMAFRELLKLLGIKSNLMTAYHPQTDRATECVNKEIKAYLLIYCSAHPTEWKNLLSTPEFKHNNRRHADWTHTLFKLMHGKAPLVIPTSFENTKFPSVVERIKNLVTSREEALAAHELARSQMAEQIKSNFTPFKKGQIVWLDTRHLKMNYHKKMAPKQEGPFEIEEVLDWSLTSWNCQNPQSLPRHSLMSIQRKQSLWRIMHDHYWTSKMEKKSMKSNKFWNIEEEDRVTDTLSNGLDIQSPKPHGNQNLVSQEQQRSCRSTKNATSCKAICISLGRQNWLLISTNQGNTSLTTSSRNSSS